MNSVLEAILWKQFLNVIEHHWTSLNHVEPYWTWCKPPDWPEWSLSRQCCSCPPGKSWPFSLRRTIAIDQGTRVQSWMLDMFVYSVAGFWRCVAMWKATLRIRVSFVCCKHHSLTQSKCQQKVDNFTICAMCRGWLQTILVEGFHIPIPKFAKLLFSIVDTIGPHVTIEFCSKYVSI